MCSQFSFFFSPAQVAPFFAHADFSSCVFSVRVATTLMWCTAFVTLAKHPKKISLRPPHADLNIFAPQFKAELSVNLKLDNQWPAFYVFVSDYSSHLRILRTKLVSSWLYCTCHYVGSPALSLEVKSLDSMYFNWVSHFISILLLEHMSVVSNVIST